MSKISCYFNWFLYGKTWLEILHLIKNNQGQISLRESLKKNHLFWKTVAERELKVTKTTDFNQTNILSKFLQKATNLDLFMVEKSIGIVNLRVRKESNELKISHYMSVL